MGKHKPIEERLPEEFAEVFDSQGDPLARVEKLLEMADMPKRTARAILNRIRARFSNAQGAYKELRTQDIIDQLDGKIGQALEYMDDTAFAKANLRDLGIVLGILIEKRQLLRGEPTQILSVQERKQLNESIPLIVQEAQRRGMLIDVTPESGHEETGVSARVIPRTRTERELNQTEARMKKHRKELELE